MTKTELQQRLNFLIAGRDSLNTDLTKVAANISAYNGAIEECKYWIDAVSAEESVVAVIPEEQPDSIE